MSIQRQRHIVSEMVKDPTVLDNPVSKGELVRTTADKFRVSRRRVQEDILILSEMQRDMVPVDEYRHREFALASGMRDVLVQIFLEDPMENLKASSEARYWAERLDKMAGVPDIKGVAVKGQIDVVHDTGENLKNRIIDSLGIADYGVSTD